MSLVQTVLIGVLGFWGLVMISFFGIVNGNMNKVFITVVSMLIGVSLIYFSSDINLILQQTLTDSSNEVEDVTYLFILIIAACTMFSLSFRR